MKTKVGRITDPIGFHLCEMGVHKCPSNTDGRLIHMDEVKITSRTFANEMDIMGARTMVDREEKDSVAKSLGPRRAVGGDDDESVSDGEDEKVPGQETENLDEDTALADLAARLKKKAGIKRPMDNTSARSGHVAACEKKDVDKMSMSEISALRA